jgi:hypothetical protein
MNDTNQPFAMTADAHPRIAAHVDRDDSRRTRTEGDARKVAGMS